MGAPLPPPDVPVRVGLTSPLPGDHVRKPEVGGDTKLTNVWNGDEA